MTGFDPFAELPEGFAMALAQDPAALDAFGRLPKDEKAHYVTRSHQVSSRDEMRALVSELDHKRTL